jgi:hypothetical protein
MVMGFTTDEKTTLAQVKVELDRTGSPELIAKMEVMESEGASFNQLMKIAALNDPVKVQPERAVEIKEHPPLSGKGATSRAWKEFALQASDMDPEIIESMGMRDIITVLSDKGIILLGDE